MAMTDILNLGLFITVILFLMFVFSVFLIVFVIMQLISIIKSKKIKSSTKFWLIFLWIFTTPVLVSFIWWILRKKLR